MRENSHHDTLGAGFGVDRVVAGRYRLRSAVGAGGMGVVWRADDLRLSREVALKRLRLPPDLSPDETARARQRVFREGRIAARLQHPNAVAVYDVTSDDVGEPMLVLEYLPSQSLDAVLDDLATLPPARVARIGAAVASALAAAHAVGVVHRDVKPGNILLADDGDAKITDFGLSHVAGDTAGDGTVAGTPAFLSPEAARGGPPSPASDVFSLGATLYAAVEGTPPFGKADDPREQLELVADGQAPPPRQAGPLTGVLTIMLRDDPTARPTMSRVAEALADIAANQPADPDADVTRPVMLTHGSTELTHDSTTTRIRGGIEATTEKTEVIRGGIEAISEKTGVIRGSLEASSETTELPRDTAELLRDATERVRGEHELTHDTTEVIRDATIRGASDLHLDMTGPIHVPEHIRNTRDDTHEDLEPVSVAASAEPRRGRRRLYLVLGVLAALLVAFLAFTTLTGDDVNNAPTNGPSSAAPTPGTQPPALPPTVPAETAPAATDAQPVDPAALQKVVTDYYTLLPADTNGAWALLGPAMQAQDRQLYDQFWAGVKDLRIRAEPRVEGNTVVVEIDYIGQGRVREIHVHEILVQDGVPLINSDQVLSGGPGPGGPGPGGPGPGRPGG